MQVGCWITAALQEIAVRCMLVASLTCSRRTCHLPSHVVVGPCLHACFSGCCVSHMCRTVSNVVYLSNVTLWVPAAEFSFIRSHTAEQPKSFTINLQGEAGRNIPSSDRQEYSHHRQHHRASVSLGVGHLAARVTAACVDVAVCMHMRGHPLTCGTVAAGRVCTSSHGASYA